VSLDPTAQRAAKSFEVEWAARVGGKVTPGSGNQWHSKQDVGSVSFLWSLKFTTKKSFSITQDVLDDVAKDTWSPGGKSLIPAIGIRIGSPEYDVVVMRYSDFESLARGELIIVGEEANDHAKEAWARTPELLRGSD